MKVIKACCRALAASALVSVHLSVLLSLAQGAQAAEAKGFLRPPESSSVPFSSTTQHYVFRGLHPEDQAVLARWFEEIEVRVESMTGLQVPFRRAEILRTSGANSPPANQGDVELTVMHIEGLLHQRLLLVNPEYVTELDVAGALVVQLLHRYVFGIQTAREDDVVPFRIPDWLSEGVTQNLNNAWRERNARYVSDRWKAGRGRTVQSILSLAQVQQMRSDERAWAGAVVTWLTEERMEAQDWETVFRRLAGGKPLEVAWLREEVLGFDSDRDLEKSWDLWMAGKTLVRQDLGTVSPALMQGLRDLLRRAPQDFGVQPSARTPDELQPGDLIERRDQAWIRPYATRLILELEDLSSGTAQEFQEVVDLYRNYYTSLIRAGGNRGGLIVRSTAGASLRNKLEAAEGARAHLEQTMELRGDYLEGVGTSLREEPPAADPELRRDRKDFLENVERRLENP